MGCSGCVPQGASVGGALKVTSVGGALKMQQAYSWQDHRLPLFRYFCRIGPPKTFLLPLTHRHIQALLPPEWSAGNRCPAACGSHPSTPPSPGPLPPPVHNQALLPEWSPNDLSRCLWSIVTGLTLPPPPSPPPL